jgi:hypothetical protein
MAAAADGPADGLMADKLNNMARAFSDAKEGKIMNLLVRSCNMLTVVSPNLALECTVKTII